MTAAQDDAARAVEALRAAGFVEDGATRTEDVRIPTVKSPVFGGIGGEVATFGGRRRFARPGTPMKATVGARTVCFYDVDAGVTGRMENVAPKDLDRIRELAKADSVEAALAGSGPARP